MAELLGWQIAKLPKSLQTPRDPAEQGAGGGGPAWPSPGLADGGVSCPEPPGTSSRRVSAKANKLPKPARPRLLTRRAGRHAQGPAASQRQSLPRAGGLRSAPGHGPCKAAELAGRHRAQSDPCGQRLLCNEGLKEQGTSSLTLKYAPRC